MHQVEGAIAIREANVSFGHLTSKAWEAHPSALTISVPVVQPS
jgi:hypothetical protein